MRNRQTYAIYNILAIDPNVASPWNILKCRTINRVLYTFGLYLYVTISLFALTTRSLLTHSVPCARCTRAIIQCRNWIRSPNPRPPPIGRMSSHPSAVLPRNYIFYEGVCRKWYLMSTDQTGSDPGCMHVADNQCDGEADVREERRKTSGPWSLQLMCPRKWRKRNTLECLINGFCIKLLRLLAARSTVHRSVTGLSTAPANICIRFSHDFHFARFGISQCDDNVSPDREILVWQKWDVIGGIEKTERYRYWMWW